MKQTQDMEREQPGVDGFAPVSVLMSTFNRAPYLPQAIDGLLHQTMPPRQIIVVDDGSTDETPAILDRYGDRITVVRQENAGKSVALNRAIPSVAEEFIWVFDDDDLPVPDALERLYGALAENPWADFAYGPFFNWFYSQDGESRTSVARMEEFPPDELFPRLLEHCFFLQQGSLVRTRCFRDVGGYSLTLKRSLDYEFQLRMARRYMGVRVQGPLFYYRLHDGPRGSAADQFAGSERDRRWYEVDQVIFSELASELRLWEYLPRNRKQEPPAQFDEKTAIFRRIGVMGRKGLWERVSADIRRLTESGLLSDDLTADQRRSLGVSFSSQFSILSLVRSPGLTRELVAALRAADSTELRLLCAYNLYHHTPALRRSSEHGLFLRLLRVVIRLLGARALGRAILYKAGLADIQSVRVGGR